MQLSFQMMEHFSCQVRKYIEILNFSKCRYCLNTEQLKIEHLCFVAFVAGDDRRILLWNFHKAIHSKCTPVTLQAEHTSNVFSLAFNSNNTKIFSGGNDDQVIVHDTAT
jgi:WD repeat-containing protein 22